jgi:hypothetical protein
MTLSRQQILDLVAKHPIDAFGASFSSPPEFVPATYSVGGLVPIVSNGLDEDFMGFLASGEFLDIALPCTR